MLTIVPFVIALAAAPQPPPSAQAPRGAAQRSALPDAELAGMLDTYAIVQAQDALQLNDAQYGQFATRLKRLQEARRRSRQARNKLIQQLRRLSSPQAAAHADDGSIRETLKALRDHDERAANEMRQAYDAVDEILDLRQQARFRVFEEAMERRKLDLLVRARERAARRR